MRHSLARIPARVSLLYAAAGGLWILLSDRVVEALLSDPVARSSLQTYKGWLFVACTAALLYVLLRADLERFSAEADARRSAEVALARSEALYRAIARNLPGGAVSVVSPSLAPLIAEGPLAAELARRDRLVEGGEPSAEDHFRAALAGEARSVEEKLGERSIWARFVPLRGDDGRTVGAMRLALDVTERERIERELREAEERLRQVVESIREVFWLRDAARDRVVYVSPAYESVWGRSASRLLAEPGEWLDAIHPEDRERVVALGVGTGGGAGYDVEYRIVRPDGEIRWIRDQAFPVADASGGLTRWSGVAEDITERRVLLEQLHQTQRLESIGLLAGGIAHDFNNLLTVIGGNCELLLRSLPADERSRGLARDIQLAGERASSLTRQLLAFSRREILEPVAIDPNAAVAETEKLLRRLLGEDVELVTRLDPQVGDIRMDPGHLAQLLVNLAVNARDAMPKGGRLTIETRTVIRDERYAASHPGVEPGRFVAIDVGDSGTGMSEEVRARAFEPFFTTKPRGQGTGLGLAVVHGIVRQNGGHVELESEPGVGTCIHLFFPALAEAAVPAPRTVADALRGHEQILLVEDEDAVRLLAARGLSSFGYQVQAARNGDEALALLARDDLQFAMLVTDVVMPGLDGRELADAARRGHPSLRVLFTSGYTDDAVLRRGVVQSEVSFLQKPYTTTSLARKIRETLDRR
ncbi:MAG: PAS domain-containing protein [bacterium]